MKTVKSVKQSCNIRSVYFLMTLTANNLELIIASESTFFGFHQELRE